MITLKRMYSIIAVFAVAAAALGAFLIYPLFTQIKSVSADILQKRGEIANAGVQNKELDAFREKFKDYEPNLQKMDALFIDAKDPLDFITFLEKVAEGSGVGISITLLSSQEKITGLWPSLAFQISATGKYAGMLDFFEQLEVGPYLTRTRKLSLRPRYGEDGKKSLGQVDADVVLEAFVKQ